MRRSLQIHQVGLNIDSESSSGCSSTTSCQTTDDDESLLETPFWMEKNHQGQHRSRQQQVPPPTHVWEDEYDESATLSPLQTTSTALALALETKSLPMMPSSDYSSSEGSNSIIQHQSCHFRSRIRQRIEQLEQESLSSDCSQDEDDYLLLSRENPQPRRRPKWRVYLALIAVTMVVLSHTRPPRSFVEIRREEVALGHHLRRNHSHSKSHNNKLVKYFMPPKQPLEVVSKSNNDNAQPQPHAGGGGASTTTTKEALPSSNRANFALAQTSQASRPVFERFEFHQEEEEPPLKMAPPTTTSWTSYFAGMTFLCLLVETTYKEYRACRMGRREERRL
jgi:hypothetical protein